MILLLKIFTVLSLLTISEDNVTRQVDNYFKEALKGYDSYKVEMIRRPENIVSVKFQATGIPKNKGIISLPAEVTYSNGKVSAAILSFRIKLYKKALFSLTDINKDDDLRAENFEYGNTEVNSINGTPVYSFDEIQMHVAKKRLKAGELLCREFIERAPIVKAGDNITASVVAGSTVISFDAVSKQDGRENEIIRITGANKKQYKAKIIDSKNVRITE